MKNKSTDIALRDGNAGDRAAVIGLNAESVLATSPMDEKTFAMLVDLSSLFMVAERNNEVVGFLMGFTDGVSLDGLNYRWFARRFKQFFYIDRIVIDDSCRGSGLGQQFYASVSEWASAQNLLWLTAEMNLDPPNLASLRFHKRQGFIEVGTQKLPDGKLVSMQVKRLA